MCTIFVYFSDVVVCEVRICLFTFPLDFHFDLLASNHFYFLSPLPSPYSPLEVMLQTKSTRRIS